MNSKVLTVISLSVAVVALSVAVAIRSVKHADAARAAAALAASQEEIVQRESRKAEAERKTAEANARAAEAKAAAESDAKARAADEAKAKASEAAAAADDREAAASAAAEAKAKARAASDLAAKAKADAAAKASEAAKAVAEEAKAKHLAEAEAEKRAAEEAKRDASVADAKALELRKIDFETWQTRLAELDQELTERERALKPDVDIYSSSNITWVAEREPDVIGETGTPRRVKREMILPEDDPSLPRPTRRLAKSERLVTAQMAACEAASSNAVVTALEKLYVRALEENRVIDADYYARSIRLLYPQWAYRPPSVKKDR